MLVSSKRLLSHVLSNKGTLFIDGDQYFHTLSWNQKITNKKLVIQLCNTNNSKFTWPRVYLEAHSFSAILPLGWASAIISWSDWISLQIASLSFRKIVFYVSTYIKGQKRGVLTISVKQLYWRLKYCYKLGHDGIKM